MLFECEILLWGGLACGFGDFNIFLNELFDLRP